METRASIDVVVSANPPTNRRKSKKIAHRSSFLNIVVRRLRRQGPGTWLKRRLFVEVSHATAGYLRLMELRPSSVL